jgi:hypothetical protein
MEASAAGVAYGAGLCWISTCLVASFRPGGLSAPYWSGLVGLRTDTCGVVAFVATAAGLVVAEYHQLRRRHDGPEQAHSHSRFAGDARILLVLALTKTALIMATGLVLYISVNSVTHPVSLGLPATHLASWPTESTLRVGALITSACSVAGLRYFRVRILDWTEVATFLTKTR